MHTTPELREGSLLPMVVTVAEGPPHAHYKSSPRAASPPLSLDLEEGGGDAARGRRRWDHRDRNRVLRASPPIRRPTLRRPQPMSDSQTQPEFSGWGGGAGAWGGGRGANLVGY